MKKVAKFIRTSTELQQSSIENQDEILDNWIVHNKFTLYKTYTDEAISGTKKKKRIQWLQMLEDAKNKKFDILICKSYSRFGRNQIETLQAIKQLREKNIRVVFLEDNLDSDMDTSRFGLMAWLAEEESKRTSTRIKGVQKHFKEVGKMFNCIPPYGYEYDNKLKKFVVNDIEAHIVKKIFKLYLQGNGTNKIASILREQNISSKNGGVWRGNTIKNIIINEAYTGTLVQGKTKNIDVTILKRDTVPEDQWIKHYNNHEAIIDTELFLKANEIFKKNSERAKKVRYSIKGTERASNISLFSNLLKCSCGSSMSIRRKNNRKPFYNCIEYERIGLKCGHQSNYIQEEFLIDWLKRRLDQLINSNFENLTINNKDHIKLALNAELTTINKEIDKQVQLSNTLLNLFSNQTITIQQFQLQNESIANTLNSLVNNKENIETKISNLSEANPEDFKKSIADIVKLPIDQWNNVMLKEVIETIIIDNNGMIKLNWNIEK